MKIKYELIENIIEIPDDMFAENATEDEKNMMIYEYILEHFNKNFNWEVIPIE